MLPRAIASEAWCAVHMLDKPAFYLLATTNRPIAARDQSDGERRGEGSSLGQCGGGPCFRYHSRRSVSVSAFHVFTRMCFSRSASRHRRSRRFTAARNFLFRVPRSRRRQSRRVSASTTRPSRSLAFVFPHGSLACSPLCAPTQRRTRTVRSEGVVSAPAPALAFAQASSLG